VPRLLARTPLWVAVALVGFTAAQAQAQARAPEPAVEDDGASEDLQAYMGAVLFQNPDDFDGRGYGGVFGADLYQLVHGFHYRRVLAELGGSVDDQVDEDGKRTVNGFRYQFAFLGGLGGGSKSSYVALGAGLSVNGDTGGAVATALTVPVELRVTGWLGSYVRLTGWLRADHFLAAYDSRERSADSVLLDELIAGARVVFMYDRKTLKKGRNAGKQMLEGLSLGVTRHETKGSAVWLLSFGYGFASAPGSASVE